MSEVATLVKRYVERYNSNDVEGMLDCCADDVVFDAELFQQLHTRGLVSRSIPGKRRALQAVGRVGQQPHRADAVVVLVQDGGRG